jgi:hypothetical protein
MHFVMVLALSHGSAKQWLEADHSTMREGVGVVTGSVATPIVGAP